MQIDDSRAILERYRPWAIPDGISYSTVEDYCDSADHLAALSRHGDLKNVQRPWALKAVLSRVPVGGSVLEIGGGDPSVSAWLSELGYNVTIVDPYDGSGYGPTDYERLHREYPAIDFVRSHFSLASPLVRALGSKFDAVYSVSVLEHIDQQGLREVAEATLHCLSPNGSALHALDFVRKGQQAEAFMGILRYFAALMGVETQSVDEMLERLETDLNVYRLSAEAHNAWRMGRPYSEYPMRDIVNINLVGRREDLLASIEPIAEDSSLRHLNPGSELVVDSKGGGGPVGAAQALEAAEKRAGRVGVLRSALGIPTLDAAIHTYGELGRVLSVLREWGLCEDSTHTVLDVGCGPGLSTAALRELVPRVRIVAADFLSEFVAIGVEQGLSDVEWKVTSTPSDLPDESFDLVVAQTLFSHLGPNSQASWLLKLTNTMRLRGTLAMAVLKPQQLVLWRERMEQGNPLWGMDDGQTQAISLGLGETLLGAGEFFHWPQPHDPDLPADWGESVFNANYGFGRWPKNLVVVGELSERDLLHDWIFLRRTE